MRKIFIFSQMILSLYSFGQNTRYWSGGGTNDDLTNPANWWDGHVPANGDHITFDNTVTGGKQWINITGDNNNNQPFWFGNIVMEKGNNGTTSPGDISIVGANTYALSVENNTGNGNTLYIGANGVSSGYGFMTQFGSRQGQDLYVKATAGDITFNSSTLNLDTGGTNTSLIIQGNDQHSVTINGFISKSGSGLGTLELHSGVVLNLNKSNVLSGMVVSGGTMNINAQNVLSGGSVHFTGQASVLNIYNGGITGSTVPMDADANVTFNLTDGTVRFGNSASQAWEAEQIVINGWTGSIGASGTGAKVFFSTNSNSLTQAQLDKISFTGYGKAMLLSNGELVPRDYTTRISAAWDNGVPTANLKAVIAEDFTVSSDITSKELVINTGKTLSVEDGVTVTTGNFTNNGTIVIGNDANFVQKEGAVNTGGGSATVHRHSEVSADREQYTLWSSPVTGQSVYGLYTSGQPVPPNRAFTYNTSNDFYTVVSAGTNFAPGVGYSIKEPVSGSANAKFTGTLNNGNITVPLDNTSGSAPFYNLIGNPYPSEIDITKVFLENSESFDLTNQEGFSIYLWDKKGNEVTSQQGGDYDGNNFAILNAITGDGVPAGGVGSSGVTPTKFIKPGQGFIMSAGTVNTITFKNSQRAVGAGSFFTRSTNDNTKSYFRLVQKAPSNYYNALLISYHDGALDSYDKYDSKIANEDASDQFFSFADDSENRLAIQGRNTDPKTTENIRLGSRSYISGNATIEIYDLNGKFSNGDLDVYLRDKHTNNLEVNLTKQGSYTFATEQGDTASRFEIFYKAGNTLATGDVKKSTGVFVSRTASGIIVSAPDKIISVEVYDMTGKLLFSDKTIQKTEWSAHPNLTHGGYVVRVTTQKEIASKKIIF